MELTDIITFVSNVGFPILACVYLARQSQKNMDRHQEEIDELREAIHQNTRAIDALTSYIKEGE